MGKRAGKASPAKKPSGSEEQDVKRQRRAGCEATADELENDARAVSTAALVPEEVDTEKEDASLAKIRGIEASLEKAENIEESINICIAILPTWKTLVSEVREGSHIDCECAIKKCASSATKGLKHLQGQINAGHMTKEEVYKTMESIQVYDVFFELLLKSGVQPDDPYESWSVAKEVCEALQSKLLTISSRKNM